MIPFKVPAYIIASLTVILFLINLVGLVKVEMADPSSRLILLLAVFLSVIRAKIFKDTDNKNIKNNSEFGQKNFWGATINRKGR
jgi:hypothetical protein